MRRTIVLLLSALALNVAAQTRPPKLEPLPEPPPPPAALDESLELQVTITKRGEDKVEEYRVSSQPNRLLAKRFAAKEAIAKALGTGIGRGVSWQDMLIVHDDNGAPRVVLSGGALEVAGARGGNRVELSLADELEYVVAFAILAK